MHNNKLPLPIAIRYGHLIPQPRYPQWGKVITLFVLGGIASIAVWIYAYLRSSTTAP